MHKRIPWARYFLLRTSKLKKIKENYINAGKVNKETDSIKTNPNDINYRYVNIDVDTSKRWPGVFEM